MSNEPVKQKTVKRRGISSPEARSPILAGVTIIFIVAVGVFLAYGYLKSNTEVKISIGVVDASSVQVETDAKTSEPILASDGRAVFMDDNGNIVDETSRAIDSVDLMAGEKNGNLVDDNENKIDEDLLSKVETRGLKQGEVSIVRKMTDSNGDAIFFDGKEVFLDSEGRLVDENGNVLTTAYGRDVSVDKNGYFRF